MDYQNPLVYLLTEEMKEQFFIKNLFRADRYQHDARRNHQHVGKILV